ncbi:MAG: VanZ family protein [Bacteroidales bacterium]|nr:VanZ family protein [Bacteroidales bacterium]
MRFRHLLPAIVWTIVIFFIIAIPGSSIPESPLFLIPHFDKIVHTGIFLLLGIFSAYGFFKQGNKKFIKRNAYTLAVVFCVLYGGLTEVIQHFYIAERTGELADIIANTTGSATGVLLFYFLRKTNRLQKILSL